MRLLMFVGEDGQVMKLHYDILTKWLGQLCHIAILSASEQVMNTT